MKIIMTLAPAILCCLIGCGRSGDQPQNAGAEHKAGQTQDAKSPDNLLRIGSEMLRDLRITTSAVEQRRGGDGVNLLGELAVNEEAYSQVSAPIAARVTKITASPGQRVSQGQQLAVLQSAELGRARSESSTAQAKLQLAQQTLERKRRLAGERIVAQRDVQEAEAAVTAAEADLRASRSTLRAFGTGDESPDSSLLILRAPISGTVIERTALNGQLAEPAQALFRIADLKTIWLNVHAFERDAVRLRAGAAAKVTLPSLPGRTLRARVKAIGNMVDPVSRTVPVRIEIANPAGVLRPGMSATAWVSIAEGTAQVITVPAASVQRIEDAWYVFIPRSQDSFEMRQVGRGRDLEGEIEIVNGLKPGETVVVEGAFLLKSEAEKARGEGKDHDHD